MAQVPRLLSLACRLHGHEQLPGLRAVEQVFLHGYRRYFSDRCIDTIPFQDHWVYSLLVLANFAIFLVWPLFPSVLDGQRRILWRPSYLMDKEPKHAVKILKQKWGNLTEQLT
jgi:hypothetical protein